MANEEENEGNAPDVEGEEEEGGGKSKKKLIIIIVAAVVLLGGIGAGAAIFLSSGSDSEPAAEGETDGESDGEEAEGKEAEGKGKKEDEGKKEGETAKEETDDEDGVNLPKVYKFKPFHLNLGNPLENRYIRLELALEYKGDEAHTKQLEAMNPRLRDAIITVASRKTREFLLGPDGKDQLRKEILDKINRYLEKKVDNVYITDIIIE